MQIINIVKKNKGEYNNAVNHPLQSYEWGEFREKTGLKVIRKGFVKNDKMIDGFTLTLHKIPYTNYKIGYLPKGNLPTTILLNELKKIGKLENCIFIQLEPNIQKSQMSNLKCQISNDWKLPKAAHPLFTKYTFVIDLRKSEDELLKNMHPKTRYNIKVAEKRGVWIEEDNSEKGFLNYLSLLQQTTARQGFYAHSSSYHELLWETLEKKLKKEELTYHLFHARYKHEEKIHTLTSWVLFAFNNTLYYPYGASSSQFRENMASNLIAWEAIRFGKKYNLSKFDMWGALSESPDKKDPWYGFHRFKQGYGGKLTEFVGSYDLIINPQLYYIYKLMDKVRWIALRLKSKLTPCSIRI